ncbi:uncharacterized protein FFB14_04953 [Fusarium fujikuroi]|nr:uncharacterized protein FFB14_04953 [Fusarium fujikuroi]
MHFLCSLLFLLDLARATPVALQDSSLETDFKLKGDDSVPVFDDPPFFELDIGNTETQKKHEKRSGPPFTLPYRLWKVTFQGRFGDGSNFTRPSWIYQFPGVYDPKGNQWDANIYDLAIFPGVSFPLWSLGGGSNGEMWYTTNSYFVPWMRGWRPSSSGRTYTKYVRNSMTKFEIIPTRNDQLARQNMGAAIAFDRSHLLPTTGYILLDFTKANLTGLVDFNCGSMTYKANITGKVFERGNILI